MPKYVKICKKLLKHIKYKNNDTFKGIIFLCKMVKIPCFKMVLKKNFQGKAFYVNFAQFSVQNLSSIFYALLL